MKLLTTVSSPENNISIHRGSHSRRSKNFPQCVMSLCFLGSYNKKQIQHIQGIVQFSGFSSPNLGRQNKQSHKLVINLLRFFLECLHAPGKNLYHTENVMSEFFSWMDLNVDTMSKFIYSEWFKHKVDGNFWLLAIAENSKTSDPQLPSYKTCLSIELLPPFTLVSRSHSHWD